MAGSAIETRLVTLTQRYYPAGEYGLKVKNLGPSTVAYTTAAGTTSTISMGSSATFSTGVYLIALATCKVTLEPIAKDFQRVVHGSNASTPRPPGVKSVDWVGSVEPTNMLDDDSWVDTSA